jgi:hypothetical protein
LPFETAETGETALIARINAVLGDLDPQGTAAPRTGSCMRWSPVSNIVSIIAAYRSILRGESLRYLVGEARDVLAASGDPHFLAAADRLDRALDAVHWRNRNQPARNDGTVRQALTDVRLLLHCDVVGVVEKTTAREAGRYIEIAVLVALWRQYWY